jgi:hypothetical protein
VQVNGLKSSVDHLQSVVTTSAQNHTPPPYPHIVSLLSHIIASLPPNTTSHIFPLLIQPISYLLTSSWSLTSSFILLTLHPVLSNLDLIQWSTAVSFSSTHTIQHPMLLTWPPEPLTITTTSISHPTCCCSSWSLWIRASS